MKKKIITKGMLIVGVIEIFVLIAITSFLVKDYQSNYYERSFSPDELKEITNYGVDYGYYLDTSSAPVGGVRIGLNNLLLRKGSYLVEIDYDCNGTSYFAVEYGHGRNEYKISGEVLLENIANHRKIEITINENNEEISMYCRMSSESSDGDYLIIQNIKITSTAIGYVRQLFLVLLVMLVLDLSLYLWWNREKITISKENRLVFAGLLAISFMASIPLFTNYLTEAHDLLFHLARIEGLKNGILNGDIPVRIQSQWLNGHGYPVSVFYGDLFLYLPALLRVIGISLQDAYKIYLIIINGATAYTAYFCFSRMSKNKKVGILAAALYTLNIYRLSNIYVRGAVGEYTAMVFFPIVLYGLWYILGEDKLKLKENKNIWILLSMGYLGILNSHLISCVMIGIFTIFVGLIMIKRIFEKERFVILMKAAAALIAGGAWFIIPLMEYMKMEFSSSGNDGFIFYRQEGRGMFWAQFFNTYYNVNGESLSVDRGMVEEMTLSLGNVFLIILIAVILIFIYDNKMICKRREMLLSLGLIGMAMWLCTYSFPFAELAKSSEVLKLLIGKIQYPWRFMAIVGVLVSWLLTLLVSRVNWKAWKEAYKYLFVFSIAAAIFLDASRFLSQIMGEKSPQYIYGEANLESMFVSGGEYLYKDAEVEDYQDDITEAGEGLEVLEWTRKKGELYLKVHNSTPEEKTLEVPLIFYKGYEAIDCVNQKEIEVSTGHSHRIKVHILKGYQGEICVRFQEPIQWRFAELISLVTIIYLGAVWKRNRKNIEKHY